MEIDITQGQLYQLIRLTAEKATSPSITHLEAAQWAATGYKLADCLDTSLYPDRYINDDLPREFKEWPVGMKW